MLMSVVQIHLSPPIQKPPSRLIWGFFLLAINAMKNRLLGIAIVLYVAASAPEARAAEPLTPAAQPVLPIASLEVARYLGTWFEIAKYPNRFQKKCLSNTTAEYTALGNGRLQVVNRCRVAGGETIEAVGEARQLGAATSPKLEVRFAPAWLSFLPWVWGNYWVIALDDKYQLAAVSEPTRETLWVLARTPQVDVASYNALLARLQQQGFDVQKLERTPQE